MLLHVKSMHEPVLRPPATATKRINATEAIMCRQATGNRLASHSMVAKATERFDADRARIQPGAAPISPVNKMAARDPEFVFEMKSPA
jgi:hypothetical protein